MAIYAKHVSLSTTATAVTLTGSYNKVLVTNKDTTAANVVSVAFNGATAVSLADDTICVPIGVTKTINVAQYGFGNATFTVTAAGATAQGAAVSVGVSALPSRIASGSTLTFSGTGVLVLSREANPGDTTLQGALTVANIANAETATATVLGAPGGSNTGAIQLSLIAAAGTPAVDIEATN